MALAGVRSPPTKRRGFHAAKRSALERKLEIFNRNDYIAITTISPSPVSLFVFQNVRAALPICVCIPPGEGPRNPKGKLISLMHTIRRGETSSLAPPLYLVVSSILSQDFSATFGSWRRPAMPHVQVSIEGSTQIKCLYLCIIVISSIISTYHV